MSSCKVENLSQIANAIHPGPKGPGLLAWLRINMNSSYSIEVAVRRESNMIAAIPVILIHSPIEIDRQSI